MPKKRKRHTWTDEEKQQIIRDVSHAVSQGNAQAVYLRGRSVSDSWFRHMREKYIAAHPDFNPSEPTKALTVALAPIETKFNRRPDVEKSRLLREYDQLLTSVDKDLWRKRYGVSNAMVSYYHKTLKGKPRKPRFSNGTLAPDRVALVREYLALGSGQKTEWLKRHQMNHQQIWEWKKRASLSGGANAPVEVDEEVLRPEVAPITLAEAILALEVRRDTMNGFIEDLKRMSTTRR